MKFGESSPEGSPLTHLADRKAAEYIAREHRKELLAAEAALQALYKKLGLEPGQTLKDYFGLKPSHELSDLGDEDLSPELAGTVDRLFEDMALVLAGEKSMDDFPSGLGAPKPKQHGA